MSMVIGGALSPPLQAESFSQTSGQTSGLLANEQVQRPNIVLILADDLGFTDIASYGSEIHTPTLSALAADGVSFSNDHTGASCAPSRAMLLTKFGPNILVAILALLILTAFYFVNNMYNRK